MRQWSSNAVEARFLEQELVNPRMSGIWHPRECLKADFLDYRFALCVEALSAHQNKERTVERDRPGGGVERPPAVARVSAGLGARDSRCAEDWESLRALPGQTRRAVLFPNPFRTSTSNMESPTAMLPPAESHDP